MSRPSVALFSAACAAALLLGAPSAHARPMPPPPPPPPDDGGTVDPQPPPPAPAPAQTAHDGFHRSGWFAGFGLAVGVLNSNDSSQSGNGGDGWSGGGIDVHFGGMLTPRIGLLFELSGGSYDAPQTYFDPSVTQAQTTVAVGAQLWLNELVWIRGGLGASKLETRVSNDQVLSSINGRSLLFAAGIELMHRTSFVLDLSGRMNLTGYPADNGISSPKTTAWNLGVGFNWY